MKYILLFASLLMVIPTAASAAVISARAVPEQIGVGDIVRVDFIIDSTTSVNAFSGVVSYDDTELRPVAISDGSSIVTNWILRPATTTADGYIEFAGITPGGYSGNKGLLFTVLFVARQSVTARVQVAKLRVLRNDGEGGEETVATPTLEMKIARNAVGGYVEPTDSVPPEEFTATIDTSPAAYDGLLFLIYASVDKKSGIDHYLISESRLPMWISRAMNAAPVRTEGEPYVLQDQNRTSTIMVTAVDRAGNTRTAIVGRTYLLGSRELFLAVLGAILLVVAIFTRRNYLLKHA